eukprot:308429-Chlamydomonas_euryale.AAC.1
MQPPAMRPPAILPRNTLRRCNLLPPTLPTPHATDPPQPPHFCKRVQLQPVVLLRAELRDRHQVELLETTVKREVREATDVARRVDEREARRPARERREHAAK